MEHLFDDLILFIDEHIQPVTPRLRERLAAVPTKGKGNYNHDVDEFFTAEQIAALYRQNPAWAAIEATLYGSLHDGRRSRARLSRLVA